MEAKEKVSPEMCVKNGKCMMTDMMEKMKPSLEDYKKMSDDEKDKVDEEDVLGDE